MAGERRPRARETGMARGIGGGGRKPEAPLVLRTADPTCCKHRARSLGHRGADGHPSRLASGDMSDQTVPNSRAQRTGGDAESPAPPRLVDIEPIVALRELPTRGLADVLGIQIVELTRERVVATMPVDERTRQPFGILHGGASVALAETAASLGAVMNVDLQRFMAV